LFTFNLPDPLTAVRSFSGSDGGNAYGLIAGSDGNIYGVTRDIGSPSDSFGTVFKESLAAASGGTGSTSQAGGIGGGGSFGLAFLLIFSLLAMIRILIGDSHEVDHDPIENGQDGQVEVAASSKSRAGCGGQSRYQLRQLATSPKHSMEPFLYCGHSLGCLTAAISVRGPSYSRMRPCVDIRTSKWIAYYRTFTLEIGSRTLI